MRTSITIPLAVSGAAASLALGFTVAASAGSRSASGAAGTSETTTAPAATTETAPTTTTEEAKPVVYTAALVTKAETPKPKGVRVSAIGTFTLSVADKGGQYTGTWKLTFHGLTGRAVAAHIHHAGRGKSGPVLRALCGPCRSGQTGTTRLVRMEITLLAKGQAYVNVHTGKNPGGEIRGQLAAK